MRRQNRIALLCTGVLAAAAWMASPGSTLRAAAPDDEKAIVHVLNRVAFGSRPGDVERIAHAGRGTYIEQQLQPERLADHGMSRRLAHLRTITMTSREIANQLDRPAFVIAELAEHKLLRAIYSERQLEEVLTDFWFNHFNVDARKGRVRILLNDYERDAIRPHALGTFRQLLEAVATSPAMLFYLDNWLSADPTGRDARPFARPQAQRPPHATAPRRGLNENYARELMELHTLGVDGGYTQKDVTEVARAFTGWTIDDPRADGGFRFEPRIHDDKEKKVLGHRIKAGGGIRDGEQVLDILASHPSTARFLSTKLARRFVSDTPPPALVDRMAARYTATGGDLRAVMRLLLNSPEFQAPSAYRTKVKTPLEFVVSAVRASGAEMGEARSLVRTMQELGMPLYQCQPPTGYKDTADAWTNTGALVNRMNFALTLGGQGLITVTPAQLQEALAHDLSATTLATIAKAATPAQAVALTLGSPEFQRR